MRLVKCPHCDRGRMTKYVAAEAGPVYLDCRACGGIGASLPPEKLSVRFKKLSPDAVVPSYAKPGDAGLDITATDGGTWKDGYREYGTGLAVEIPAGYVGLIFPRSSISNKSLSLSNSVGVIDSGYRGEIRFRFRQLDGTKVYAKGDNIGQLLIMPLPAIQPEEADELSETDRGAGGFGSSGN